MAVIDSYKKLGLAVILPLVFFGSIIVVLIGLSELGEYEEPFPARVAILFSGETQDNLTACPWIFGNDSTTVIGENRAFRTYFEADFWNEVSQYEEISRIHPTYTVTGNEFTGKSQDRPLYQYQNLTGKEIIRFDPYYVLVSINYNPEITPRSDLSDLLRDALSEKWYIEKLKVCMSEFD